MAEAYEENIIKPFFSEDQYSKLGFGKYAACKAKAINVLLVGRSQTGKTTIVKTFLDPQEGVVGTGFSDTRVPQCHHLVVQNSETNQVFQLNIIDTPGLKEVQREGESRRDEELLLLVAKFVELHITHLNLVCFVTKAGETHRHDIEVFREIEEFLGAEFSDISMMILTHCDEYEDKVLQQFERDIRNHALSKPIADYCKLKIHRFGAIDRHRMASSIKSLSTQESKGEAIRGKMLNIEITRNKLLDVFTSQPEKAVPIKSLDTIIIQTKLSNNKIISEELGKRANMKKLSENKTRNKFFFF